MMNQEVPTRFIKDHHRKQFPGLCNDKILERVVLGEITYDRAKEEEARERARERERERLKRQLEEQRLDELRDSVGLFWDVDTERLERSQIANLDALAYAKGLDVTEFTDDGQWLMFFGDTGRGKTLAMAQAAKALLLSHKYHHGLTWVTGYQLKEVYSDRDSSSAHKKEFTEDLLERGVLVIDDISLPTFSEAYGHRIAELIDTAYRDGTNALWITAQCSGGELRDKWIREGGKTLADLVKRTIRRLSENCLTVNFNVSLDQPEGG